MQSKVTILGTSNSIRAGWKEGLDSQRITIENLSIGACCSGVALCSILSPKRVLGDFTIIELAINDNNWSNRGEISRKHINLYIENIFIEVMKRNTSPIVIIMPDKFYLSSQDAKKNEVVSLYEHLAQKFHIPLINGYEILQYIEEEIDTSLLFQDRLHLKKEFAYYIGHIVQSIIDTIQDLNSSKESKKLHTKKSFYYYDSNIFQKDFISKTIGTRLRKESSITITKTKPLSITTKDTLCGVFIDTNNSKSIVTIKSANHSFSFHAYRGEVKSGGTQFLYIPTIEPLKSDGTLTISINHLDTPLDVTSKSQKEIKDGTIESLQLVGLLFYKEDLCHFKIPILPSLNYHNIIELIDQQHRESAKKIVTTYKKKVNRQLIIHIGMHKTGSSSIQESLHRYLNSPNYYYLKLEKTGNHSGKIYKLFSKKSSSKEEDRSDLIREIESSKHPYSIISGEGIIKLNLLELQTLKRFFSKWFDSIKIVAYIRTPHSYMESAFQQHLKSTTSLSSLSLEEFVGKLFPKYRERLKKFDTIFGQEHVTFWKFEPSTFPQGDVVLDFCKKLHIPIEKTTRVNESLSLEAITLLYTYHHFKRVDPMILKTLVKNLLPHKGSKFHLSSRLTKPLIDSQQSEIVWMEERLGATLQEDLIEKKGAISSEEDLLHGSLTAISLLDDLFSPLKEKIRQESYDTPQKIAKKLSLLGENDQIPATISTKKPKEKSMAENKVTLIKQKEIIEKIKREVPNIRNKEISQALNIVFSMIHDSIEKSEKGTKVSIQRLGIFAKREGINKNGEKFLKYTFKAKKGKEKN
jgi:nucleoid DNA-binding protein